MQKDMLDIAQKAIIEQTILALSGLPSTYSDYNDALWRAFGYGRQWERAAITSGEKVTKKVEQPPQKDICSNPSCSSCAFELSSVCPECSDLSKYRLRTFSRRIGLPGAFKKCSNCLEFGAGCEHPVLDRSGCEKWVGSF